LISSWLAWAAPAHGLPTHAAVPGGVAVLQVPATSGLEVRYNDTPVLTVEEGAQRYAIVGIPLSATPGTEHITLRAPSLPERQLEFRVEDKSYPTQYLTIKDQRKVNPQADDLKRINRELAQITQTYRRWTAQTVDLDFSPPVKGIPSSSFGSRRVFNGQPRNPHSGMDIAADEGTPVYAPALGKVVLVGDFFFNGNSVFLDHGQGLITMYCHLSRIQVKQGQTIKRGDRLGAVGKTGRVTGPHLHWTVSLNDARVDPSLFVEMSRMGDKPATPDGDTRTPRP
jgi:murein DD-endopeptidase MepM/ murein hydrolase activator NlpD